MNFCKPCTGLFCFTNIELCKDPDIKNLLSKQYLKLNYISSENIKYENYYQNILKEILLYSDINDIFINVNMSEITKSFIKEYLLLDDIIE